MSRSEFYTIPYVVLYSFLALIAPKAMAQSQGLLSGFLPSARLSNNLDPSMNHNCADCELRTDAGLKPDFLPKEFAGGSLLYWRDQDGNQERFRAGGFLCGKPDVDPEKAQHDFSTSTRSRMLTSPDSYQEGATLSLEDRLLTRRAERITFECNWMSRADRYHLDGRNGDEFTNILAKIHFLNESGGPLRSLMGRNHQPDPAALSNPQADVHTIDSTSAPGDRRRVWLSCDMAPGFDTAMTSWLSCTMSTGPGFTTLSAKDLNWKGDVELSIHSPARTFGKSVFESAQFDATVGYSHRVYLGDDETDRTLSGSLKMIIPVSSGYLETTFQALQIRNENSRHTFGEWDRDLQYAFGLEFVLPLGRLQSQGSSR
jgi:hypothetical protein